MLFQAIAVVAFVASSTLAAPHPGLFPDSFSAISNIGVAVIKPPPKPDPPKPKPDSPKQRRHKRSYDSSHSGQQRGNRKQRQLVATTVDESQESTVQERDVGDLKFERGLGEIEVDELD